MSKFEVHFMYELGVIGNIATGIRRQYYSLKDSLGEIKFSNTMSGEASDLEGVFGGLLTLFNNKQFRF